MKRCPREKEMFQFEQNIFKVCLDWRIGIDPELKSEVKLSWFNSYISFCCVHIFLNNSENCRYIRCVQVRRRTDTFWGNISQCKHSWTCSPAMTCCGWDLRGFYLFFHIVKLYIDTRMLENPVQLLGSLRWDATTEVKLIICGYPNKVYCNHPMKNLQLFFIFANLAEMTWKAQSDCLKKKLVNSWSHMLWHKPCACLYTIYIYVYSLCGKGACV